MSIFSPVQHQLIDSSSSTALKSFTDELYALISKGLKNGRRSVVFVCIGTDRSTGDSLGPLIGYKISKLKYENAYVVGNLDNPVHAKNIDTVMKNIEKSFDRPFIVAIDACLGKSGHVGYLSIGEGPIKPGSGVNKDLPPVGDMYVLGIVNLGGFMDFMVLQSTRLSTVMRMADLISNGINYVLWKLKRYNESIS